MKVGFYNCGGKEENRVMAGAMIRSVRRTMPGVEVVQFTDTKSSPVEGVDKVERLPLELMAIHTVKHYSRCEGEWLLLDTDVLVQKDVRDVFDDHDFDVAITDREKTMVSGEQDSRFIKLNPYNIGVVFSRNPAFWRAVLVGLLVLPEKFQRWMGNQIVAARVIATKKFKVKIIPGYIYNFPPTRTTPIHHASILHYKGAIRKRKLLKKIERGL